MIDKYFSKILTLLFLLLLSIPLFLKPQKSEIQLAVIPHFMIAPQKVQDFYQFILEQYQLRSNPPQRIILLSPNHFFPQQKDVVWVCSPQSIKFKNNEIFAHSLWDSKIHCWSGEWYSKGLQRYTKDHGLGEHFPWLNQFFWEQIPIIPLLLPTHELNHARWLAEKISQLPGKSLLIASVDFSHYLSESIALENDEIALQTLRSPDTFEQIKMLDVDCPACLGVLYLLTQPENLQVQQWWRDSSSSLVGKDLGVENTSRQFLWWKKWEE